MHTGQNRDRLRDLKEKQCSSSQKDYLEHLTYQTGKRKAEESYKMMYKQCLSDQNRGSF